MKLGQHFISDDWAKRVIDAVNLNGSSYIFEIGTGLGQLTELIARTGRPIRTIELDRDLFELSSKKFMSIKNVTVINNDALAMKPEPNEVVVTDLPFYISRRFIEWLVINNVQLAYAVLQKEFAEKLAAKPGSRNYKAISVLASYTYNMTAIFDIPGNAYSPRSPAASMLVKFELKGNPSISKDVIQKTKMAFSMRNKNATALGLAPGRKIFEIEPEVLVSVARTLQT